jgi:hypothetical protein
MAGYAELRDILEKDFCRHRLNEAIRLAHDIARSPATSSPVVPFLIASILHGVSFRWFEGQPTLNETAEIIEGRLRSPLRLLLDAVEGPSRPDILTARMNTVVRTYERCLADVPPFS